MPSIMETKEFDELRGKIERDEYTDSALELSGQEIDDGQAKALAIALMSNKHIKEVYLANNTIKNGGAQALSAIPFRLEVLDLGHNQIDARGADFLAGANVEFLVLSGNPLKSAGVKHFSRSSNIKAISLNECEAEDDGAEAVLTNNHFESISLASNGITDKGVEKIAGTSLKDLNLSQNHITSKGAAFITKHESLLAIDLSMNQVGSVDEPLPLNQKILILNLAHNRITGEDFLNICKSSTLKIMGLYSNQIRFDTHASLPENKKSLTNVDLGRNEITSTCENVLRALASISSLETLNLIGNNIDDAGASILYQYRSPSLKEIDLTNNPIHNPALIKRGKQQGS